jgi:hypothetical protein
MITGLTYLLTAVTLAILVAIGGRQRHEATSDRDFFRYQSVYVWTAFAGIIFFLAAPFVVYIVPSKNDTPSQLYDAMGVFWSIAALMGWGFLYMRKHCIEINGDIVSIHRIRRSYDIALRDVSRFVLVQGGRGGQELSLYDFKDKRLLFAASTLQDFDGLVATIKSKLSHHAVRYEYRDRLGKWISQDRP